MSDLIELSEYTELSKDTKFSENIELLKDEDITVLDEKHKFIQKQKGFRFSTDAVLLCDFFLLKKNGKVLDIGTGNGIIPVLLLIQNKIGQITGIDILKENTILAQKNININNFNDKAAIINMDIKDYSQGNTFDYIISNPPYMPLNGKKINIDMNKSVGRHEINLDLENFVFHSKRLLRPIGSLTFIHRSHRLQEIITILSKYNFGISRIKFVHYREENSSNLVLIEALKGKKHSLIIENPLFLKNN